MELISLVISTILDLDWIVKGPGLILMAVFLLRAALQLLTFHPIRAATNVVYCVIVALVLFNYGAELTVFLSSLVEKQSANP